MVLLRTDVWLHLRRADCQLCLLPVGVQMIRISLEVRGQNEGESRWIVVSDDQIEQPGTYGAGFSMPVDGKTVEVSVKYVPDDMGDRQSGPPR